jgi:hypothetical protein
MKSLMIPSGRDDIGNGIQAAREERAWKDMGFTGGDAKRAAKFNWPQKVAAEPGFFAAVKKRGFCRLLHWATVVGL